MNTVSLVTKQVHVRTRLTSALPPRMANRWSKLFCSRIWRSNKKIKTKLLSKSPISKLVNMVLQ